MNVTYKHIAGYILFLSLSSGLIRLFYPIDVWKTWLIPVEVAHIPQYLSLFFLGTFFQKADALRFLNLRNGVFFFFLSVLAFFSHFFIPEIIAKQWFVQSSVESILCVGLSIGIMCFFKVKLNTQSNLLRSLSENAYGIYLVHVFIVIVIQKLLLKLEFTATVKFIFVSVAAFVLSYFLSYLIRLIPVVKKIV